jgi:hypothetical protein
MEAMYRQNVAPAQATPIDVTRQAVKSCAQIQIGVAVMNAVGLTLLTIQFFFYRPPPAFNIPLETIHEWRLTGILVGGGYVLAMGAWGLLNAWALGKRSKAARWSSLAFAGASIASCYAWPFGGFLLYMLLRRDVKAYFD